MKLSPACRDIISGKNQSLKAALFRTALNVPALLYAAAINARNRAYDRGLLKIVRLPVPVICIGNITAGGTGKTPMVVWLCRYLQQKALKPAILTRGYKAIDDQGNDEVRLLRQLLPDVPVVVDSNRARSGQYAIDHHQAQVLIMDDGFQHRRLHRDLDIVLIDCTCPFGYGSVLPRGLLRELPTALNRADVIMLTRTDQISNGDLNTLQKKLHHCFCVNEKDSHRTPIIAQCRHQPLALGHPDGSTLMPDALNNKTVLAFCALGNPQAFVQSLNQLGAHVVAQRFFDDHYHYTVDDYQKLNQLAQQKKADWLLTTEKDWVKLQNLAHPSEMTNIRWLTIENKLTQNRQLLCRKVDQLLTDKNLLQPSC